MAHFDTFDVDDLDAPELSADPYTFFKHLRETDPVHWNPHRKTWIVTRYEDVATVARSPDVFSSAPPKPLPKAKDYYPPIEESAWDLVDRVHPDLRGHLGDGLGEFVFVSKDRPDHLRMRGAVHRWFTPRSIERLRELVRTTVDRLIDSRYADHQMEFKEDFATRLPFLAIRVMLDIPESDALVLKKVSSRLTNPPDGIVGAVSAVDELSEYFIPLLDERAKSPGEDILSLIAAGERSGVYTRPQALSTAITLLLAGHQTTLTLLSNGLHSFIKNPDQWDLLRADPDEHSPLAVEECLRYEPSFVFLHRHATRDVELSGTLIREGDGVYSVISSANRDPRVFDKPDTFDITRFPNRHLSFGVGIHHCIGAYLARMESQEAFGALAKRFKRFELSETNVEYLPDVPVHFQHQPITLNVTW
jgi:cytochrome P450